MTQVNEAAENTLEIWKWGYFPFTLGGEVHRPIKTTVAVGEPLDLGKGYSGYLIEGPNGQKFIAEATSGGIVGPDLKSVREDIASGDEYIMAAQVAAGIDTRKEAKTLTVERFFSHFKGQTAR